MHPECESPAINGHILQKEKVLKEITSDFHFCQLEDNIFGYLKDDSHAINPFIIKEVGKNYGFSFPMFCRLHDDTIFSAIEKDVDFDNLTELQIALFCYRSVCAEIRKKEIVLKQLLFAKQYAESKGASHLLTEFNNLEADIAALELEMLILPIVFKNNLEKILNGEINSQFKFIYEQLDYEIPICISTMMSPNDPRDYFIDQHITKEQLEHNICKSINDQVVISIFPYRGKTYVIGAALLHFLDGWVDNFLGQWKNLAKEQAEREISKIIACYTNNWCISKDCLTERNIQLLEQYWHCNSKNYQRDQNWEHNIFAS